MDQRAPAEPGPGGEDLHFPPDPAQLSATRRTVHAWAERAGLDDGGIDDLVLAVSEAATNAIVHSEGSRVQVRASVEGSRVVVEVSDDGLFRPAGSVKRSIDEGGRGLPLLLALVDEVTFAPGTERHPGTRVRLVKDREAS